MEPFWVEGTNGRVSCSVQQPATNSEYLEIVLESILALAGLAGGEVKTKAASGVSAVGRGTAADGVVGIACSLAHNTGPCRQM